MAAASAPYPPPPPQKGVAWRRALRHWVDMGPRQRAVGVEETPGRKASTEHVRCALKLPFPEWPGWCGGQPCAQACGQLQLGSLPCGGREGAGAMRKQQARARGRASKALPASEWSSRERD